MGNQADFIGKTGKTDEDLSMAKNVMVIDVTADDCKMKSKVFPHSRLNLFSKLKRCDSLSAPRKRKVGETSFNDSFVGITNKKQNPTAYVISEAIDSMVSQVQTLKIRIQENPNTLRAIKEIAAKMGRNAETLSRSSSKEWIEKHLWEDPEIPKYEVDTQTPPISPQRGSGEGSENRTIEAEWERIKEKQKELDRREQNIRHREERLRVWEKNNIIDTVKGIETLQQWREIASRQWSQTAFITTEIKVGNPILSKDEVIKVILVDKEDLGMETNIQRMYRDRFPELLEITNDFEALEQQTKRYGEDEVISTRKIFKITHDGTEEDTWGKLRRLRDETKEAKWVALHKVSHLPLDRLRKMAECIFCGGDTRVVIYTDRVGGELANKRQRPGSARETYALVVDAKRENYRDTLIMVKNSIKEDAATGAVKSIKSTREGKVLITVEKDKDKLEQIENLIKAKSGELKIRKIGEKANEALHLRGMDADTKIEEIKAAIDGCLEATERGSYTLSAIRPNARDTLAITIATSKAVAEKLDKLRTVRVGMVDCSINRRINIKRCQKCWEYGHSVSACTGVDRSKHCFKCGDAEHTAQDCRKEEWCPLCDKGHRAGSGTCALFKRALSQARRESRKLGAMETETQGLTEEKAAIGSGSGENAVTRCPVPLAELVASGSRSEGNATTRREDQPHDWWEVK